MKIAIVNSFFPPWRGGAETYAYNLARVLSSLRHVVTVFCGNAPLLPGVSREEGVTVRRQRLLGRIYGTPLMPSLFTDLLKADVDLYHANFPSPYIAFTVASVSSLRNVPAVLTWHNDLPPVTPLASTLIRTHDTAILPLYIRKYKRVIATSEAYLEKSRILHTLRKLVTVIPNGVDCNRFRPDLDSEPLRQKLALEGKFTIIFVGALTRWHRYKGLDVLLIAMKIALGERQDMRLLVVGDGELKAEYERTAAGLGISGNIFFLGDVPDAELPNHYASANVAVVPSKDQSEGFGLTILEANATGKPVVASKVGGIPSVITDGHNGMLVTPNDATGLANAILYLAENPEAAAAMGRNGRKVAEEHDWKRTATLTEQVYADALTPRKS